MRGPREFRHTLETLVNGMIELGFNVVKLHEVAEYDRDAVLEPGTWEHFNSIAPPYLRFWSVYRGGVTLLLSASVDEEGTQLAEQEVGVVAGDPVTGVRDVYPRHGGLHRNHSRSDLA